MYRYTWVGNRIVNAIYKPHPHAACSCPCSQTPPLTFELLAFMDSNVMHIRGEETRLLCIT